MDTPNIFKYANSELAQDAFICWLLDWANPCYKEIDESLNETAQNFVKSLFNKHEDAVLPKIESVKVQKQDNGIDVGAIVNDRYYLLIEDKTNTKNHSNQLWRYYTDVLKRTKSQDSKFKDIKDIIPIYLKTYDQSQFSLEIFKPNHKEIKYHPPEPNTYKVKIRKEFRSFLRNDFLKVLNGYQGQNEVLLQFRNRFLSIEKSVNNFSEKQIKCWKKFEFIGFYQKLQKELDVGYWKRVNNENGGFYAYIWPRKKDRPDRPFYMQFEGNKGQLTLCFKIYESDKSLQSSVRNERSKQLIKYLKSSEIPIKITKPKRFGKGKYMTVGIAHNFPPQNSDGMIEFKKTKDLLLRLNQTLEKCPLH
mgnify:CR=1 FL=1